MAQAKPGHRGQRCPICREATVFELRPFCSKHCSDIDLGRWFDGSYAVAGKPDEDEDGDDSHAAKGGRGPVDDEA